VNKGSSFLAAVTDLGLYFILKVGAPVNRWVVGAPARRWEYLFRISDEEKSLKTLTFFVNVTKYIFFITVAK
jgi:hypothetical protein